jgi:hypothetical protein
MLGDTIPDSRATSPGIRKGLSETGYLQASMRIVNVLSLFVDFCYNRVLCLLGGAYARSAGLKGLTNSRGETCLYPKTRYQGGQR